MTYTLGNLRVEKSKGHSGHLLESSIPLLKEDRYYVKNIQLDGDAPKQFIRAYFYEEGSAVRKASRTSWTAYIAKTAEKWYPHESVIEFMINRIGQKLGLRMNEIRLVRANQQIRFLSRYFLNKNERLIHGAEICGEHLGDMDMAREIAENRKTARELFTFEFIRDAIRSVFRRCRCSTKERGKERCRCRVFFCTTNYSSPLFGVFTNNGSGAVSKEVL